MIQMSAILPTFVGHILTHGTSRYRLLEPLGHGAYGVVYLALDLSSPESKPRFYAIKCLLRHIEESDLARNQEREIHYHKMVSDHQNVVTLHHVIVEEHYVFLVMDLCGGGDLFNAIMDKGHFVNNDAAIKRTFLQLIDAVHACHQQGIYHRDLKPENVLCSDDFDQIYLADFGLASQIDISDTFGCGSSFYMSPECLGIISYKAPYCPRNSDVWSLGVILSNMITGRNPWHVASPEDPGFADFLRNGASFLRRALPISRSAARLLTRTFDPDPDVRYTLYQLRVAIENIDSFFPPTKAANFPKVPPIQIPQQLRIQQAEMEEISFAPNVLGSLPNVAPPAPIEDIVVTPFVNQTPQGSPSDEFSSPPALSPSAGSHIDSPAESEGPTTPVSVAQNPAIVGMPDLALSVQEGMLASKHRGLLSKHTLSLSSSRSRLHKGMQRFVDAVHKVKVRS